MTTIRQTLGVEPTGTLRVFVMREAAGKSGRTTAVTAYELTPDRFTLEGRTVVIDNPGGYIDPDSLSYAWGGSAPVAAFSALPTAGNVPLAVSFADMSSNGPTSWAWDFGDGSTSTAQSPTHTYATAGTYDVTLTVTNSGGSDTATEPGLIVASPAGASYVATVTIPAGAVSSTLTNFVTRVDLSDMPADWWSDVSSDGGNIRVKQAGTVIPFDLVAVAPALMAGELFFRATLNSGSDNAFTIDKSGTGLLAASDSNGRNAVWSDYDVMIDGRQPTVNRSGVGTAAIAGGVLPSIGPVSRGPATGCHQGVAVDADGNFYTFDDDEIVKWSPAWVEIARSTTPLADSGIAGVNHIGDGTVYNGELYTVVEYFTTGTTTWTNQHVAVYNLADLTFNRSYDISANGHEVSSLAYNPSDGSFYLTDWTSAGASVLHKYSSSFAYLGTVALSSSVPSKQGIAYHGGYWWMSSDTASSAKAIWRANLDGTGVTQAAGAYLGTSTGDNLEGITSDGTRLYVMFDQGATNRRVYTYEETGTDGWVHFDVRGYVKVTGFPLRTTWTMGVTSRLAKEATANRALISHSNDSGTDANRATLAASNTRSKYAVWNSTSSWLDDPGSTPARFDNLRLHVTHDGSAARAIWRNGVQAATGATATRPVTGGALFIGAEDTTNAEGDFGALARAYLRNGVLSADWLAAEVASWEQSASFYTVS